MVGIQKIGTNHSKSYSWFKVKRNFQWQILYKQWYIYNDNSISTKKSTDNNYDN